VWGLGFRVQGVGFRVQGSAVGGYPPARLRRQTEARGQAVCVRESERESECERESVRESKRGSQPAPASASGAGAGTLQEGGACSLPEVWGGRSMWEGRRSGLHTDRLDGAGGGGRHAPVERAHGGRVLGELAPEHVVCRPCRGRGVVKCIPQRGPAMD